MYVERIHLNRLPDECGGDPAVPFKKVVALEWDGPDTLTHPPGYFGWGVARFENPHDRRQFQVRPFQFPITGVITIEAAFEVFDAMAIAHLDKLNRMEQEQMARQGNGIRIASEIPASIDQIKAAVDGVIQDPDKQMFGGFRKR
jgi:hypothetical protein